MNLPPSCARFPSLPLAVHPIIRPCLQVNHRSCEIPHDSEESPLISKVECSTWLSKSDTQDKNISLHKIIVTTSHHSCLYLQAQMGADGRTERGWHHCYPWEPGPVILGVTSWERIEQEASARADNERSPHLHKEAFFPREQNVCPLVSLAHSCIHRAEGWCWFRICVSPDCFHFLWAQVWAFCNKSFEELVILHVNGS